MDALKEILLNFAIQLVFTVGIVFLFGLLIALCRCGFCRLIGRAGPGILLATGIVGTPIHELSHALMCLLFGHKIKEIKLYQPRSNDGSLGYVSHSYNPKNLYHQIGNFFIGIAPILGGSGVLLLLMRLLVPSSFETVFDILGKVGNQGNIGEMLGVTGDFFTVLFDPSHADDWHWWLFILLALMISSHMELSGADIKGGIKGLLLLCALLFLTDGIVGLISLSALGSMTRTMLIGGMLLSSFLSISGLFSLLLLALALLYRLISLPFRG